MKNKKLPHNIHKWQGNEDLSNVNDQFISSIIFSITRVEEVLLTDIINKPDHPLFYSALLNILVSTRDLMQKRYDLVGISAEHKELFQKVRNCRNCLCHSDNENMADKKAYFNIGWLAQNYDTNNPYCKITTNPLTIETQDGPPDDVEIYFGSEICWLKKDILKAYTIIKSYFEERLKDDVEFAELCLRFNNRDYGSL